MKPVDPEMLLNTWPERQRLWARELRLIRLGESITEQLEKRRRISWVIMGVTGWIAFLIVALFIAFKSPGTGLVVAGVIFGPIIVSAWIGFRTLEKRTLAYLREKAAVEASLNAKKVSIGPDF